MIWFSVIQHAVLPQTVFTAALIASSAPMFVSAHVALFISDPKRTKTFAKKATSSDLEARLKVIKECGRRKSVTITQQSDCPIAQSYRLAEQEQSDRSLIENSETNTDWERPTTAIEKWLRTWIKARMQKHIPLSTVTLSAKAVIQPLSRCLLEFRASKLEHYLEISKLCKMLFIGDGVHVHPPSSQYHSGSNTMSLTQPIEIDQGDFFKIFLRISSMSILYLHYFDPSLSLLQLLCGPSLYIDF